MSKNSKAKAGRSDIHFSKAGVAAIVAICIGLNAAMFFGISRLNRDPGSSIPAAAPETAAPEIDETHPQYMVVTDAMPTGIVVKITNDSGHDLDYHPQFIIMQDGDKVADTELPPDMFYVQSPILQGVCGQQLSFVQLPAGSYTLVNLTESGTAEGTLGHVDFEISSEFDSMIRIPDVRRMHYDEAKALLEEMGAAVEKRGVVYTGGDLETDDVVTMEVPAYKIGTDESGNETRYFHGDGSGYWINKGDTVCLNVNNGTEGDTAAVPYVIGQGWEYAKDTLLNLGFYVDKRTAYYDDIPAGTVAEETVGNETVPEEGMEVPVGSYVRISVSLGKQTDTASAETVTVPDFTGMDWETAKRTAQEAGFLLAKMPCEPDGKTPGTVTMHHPPAGEHVRNGSVLVMYVAKNEGEPTLAMTFRVTEPHEGCYYFCIRNEAQEIIGNTIPFRMNMEVGESVDCAYPDCSEENTRAEALLVNYETKQEAVIGSYILHPETGTYDIISEDIEAAFRQIQ